MIFRLLLLLLSFLIHANAHAQSLCNAPNLAPQARATAIGIGVRDSDPRYINDTSYQTEAYFTNWLRLDFSNVTRFNTAVLHLNADELITNFDLQVSNGSVWTSVARIRDNADTTVTMNFSEYVGRSLRIVLAANSVGESATAYELELFRCNAPNTGTVRGSVRNVAGFSMSQVTVQLGQQSRVTGSNGQYEFLDVPNGMHQLQISKAGWTFGSAQLLSVLGQVQVAGSEVIKNFTGYDRHPIVYVHGWTDNANRFSGVRSSLTSAGYLGVDASVLTQWNFTPPIEVNAERLVTAINQALFQSGQQKVILMGHSMGGLISRAYVESGLYRSDVSELFTFASPHLGVPSVMNVGCALGPAPCQMTQPGMIAFNLIHHQRPGVRYHVIAGNAPMWTQRRICVGPRWFRWCFTIPWPDTSFRNGWGWALGAIIPGQDDAFVQTFSAVGMPGLVDRKITQEIHNTPSVGNRDAFSWDGVQSQQGYADCIYPVLIARSRNQCGGLLRGQDRTAAPQRLSELASLERAQAMDEPFAQRSASQTEKLSAGVISKREIWIDGSATIFNVRSAGSELKFWLTDPTGKRFDADYAASILCSESGGGNDCNGTKEPTDQDLHEVVMYSRQDDVQMLQVPKPMPGRWQMFVVAESSAEFVSDVLIDGEARAEFSIQQELSVGETVALDLRALDDLKLTGGWVEFVLADGKIQREIMRPKAGAWLQSSWKVPNVTGPGSVRWMVRGSDQAGHPFERAGSVDIAISSPTLTMDGLSERTIFDSDGKIEAIEIHGVLTASYNGTATVGGSLVDSQGNIVAGSAQTLKVTQGTNRVSLHFIGSDLFLNKATGVLGLKNLLLLDPAQGGVAAANYVDSFQTMRYDYLQFQAPKSE
jgi:pimeloyl-ACP methyl ester carboxylesterase